MKTVFYPVTPEVAGQIMKVKELVAVREVDRPLTKEELKAERRPDAGFYLESAVPRWRNWTGKDAGWNKNQHGRVTLMLANYEWLELVHDAERWRSGLGNVLRILYQGDLGVLYFKWSI
jgi:hypothetical protein